jgi:EpsI family protein
MAERKVNFIVAVILLALAACGVLFITSFRKVPALDVKLLEFPMQVGEWTGTDMPMDKRVYEILGTDKVLLRQYADKKDERVWLAVVYGEQKRQSFHPPEYCYLGGGNVELLNKEITKIKIDEQKSMDVNKLTFQMGKYKQLVLYWFTAGDLMTENYYKQQIYFVMNQLKYRKSGGTLVRVSTTIIDDDTAGAVDRCQRFILEALKILPSYL